MDGRLLGPRASGLRRPGHWVLAAVVAATLAVGVPVVSALTSGRSDGPWGSGGEEWLAQYLLVLGDAAGYGRLPAAFYAPDAVVDLRPRAGLVLDVPAALEPRGGDHYPLAMNEGIQRQGWYLGASSAVVLLAGPPVWPFVPGFMSPQGAVVGLPQALPRHVAVLLELGQGRITRQVELADPDTWGDAPRRCDETTAHAVVDRYLDLWAGGTEVGASSLYAADAVVRDGATGRSAHGVSAIEGWVTETGSTRGAPRAVGVEGAAAVRAWYVTCDPTQPVERILLALQRLDPPGCPVDYVADLRVDPEGTVLAEDWLTAPASARRCFSADELDPGIWADLEPPSPVAVEQPSSLRRPEQVVSLVDTTPALTDQLSWALDRYAEAGLPVPVVRSVTWVPRRDSACQVVNGLAVARSPVEFDVTLCFSQADACTDLACSRTEPWTRNVVLHELAHVWLAQHAGAAVEDAYVRHARLRSWDAPRTPYHLRGVERACWDIAAGLMDEPRPEPPTDPEVCRWYDDGFRLLTGVDPLSPACA